MTATQLRQNQQSISEQKALLERRVGKRAQRQRITGSTMMFVNNCVGDVLLTIGYRFGKLGVPLGAVLLTYCFVYQSAGFAAIAQACALTGSAGLLELVG